MKLPKDSEYEQLTKKHYQDEQIANKYREEYEGPIRLSKLPARIIAQRERHIINNLLKLHIQNGQTVLDIPCGTGKLARVLSNFPVSVTASDISNEMMHLAANDYKAVEGFCGFVQADASKTDFPDKSFDWVICLRLLHRVPSEVKENIIKELIRVSSKYLIISFGLIDNVQKVRFRFRQLFRKDISLPYPIDWHDFSEQIQKYKDLSINLHYVLPIFSSEVIVFIEKNNLQ